MRSYLSLTRPFSIAIRQRFTAFAPQQPLDTLQPLARCFLRDAYRPFSHHLLAP